MILERPKNLYFIGEQENSRASKLFSLFQSSFPIRGRPFVISNIFLVIFDPSPHL